MDISDFIGAGPQEASAERRQAAASLREMYLTIRSGGFSMIEACIIIGTIVAQEG